jgi:hypothetical protein
MKIIDADTLPRHGRRGGVVYWKDIENAPTIDVESLIIQHENIGYERGYRDGYAEAWEVLDDAEPVKHGHWIDVNGDGSLWRCSLCEETQCCKSNYCGDCGAKMDEVEE